MAILDIITLENDDNGILLKVAEEVNTEELADLQPLIDNMIDTMHDAGALGLAAPQIGVSKRIFVLKDGTVCINPGKIMGRDKITSRHEGCLSVGKGARFNVKRIKRVILDCLDRSGKPQRLRPRDKMVSIAIQHEIDHLNGKLICDVGKLA